MNHKIECWLSYPKSLYVCLKLLPFRQAIKMPILVRYNVRLYSLGGKVILPVQIRKAMIQIGFLYVETHDITHIRTVLAIDGTVEFKGSASIGSGALISVKKNAHLTIGDSMISSCTGHIVCAGNIKIGNGFLMGWDALVMDTDYHSIENMTTHQISPTQNDVIIGSHVWLATRSMVLKGSMIPDGCVIGANTVVTGNFEKENCIIAGNPARIVKEGYTWHL